MSNLLKEVRESLMGYQLENKQLENVKGKSRKRVK